jgi:hypothetical protein
MSCHVIGVRRAGQVADGFHILPSSPMKGGRTNPIDSASGLRPTLTKARMAAAQLSVPISAAWYHMVPAGGADGSE